MHVFSLSFLTNILFLLLNVIFLFFAIHVARNYANAADVGKIKAIYSNRVTHGGPCVPLIIEGFATVARLALSKMHDFVCSYGECKKEEVGIK